MTKPQKVCCVRACVCNIIHYTAGWGESLKRTPCCRRAEKLSRHQALTWSVLQSFPVSTAVLERLAGTHLEKNSEGVLQWWHSSTAAMLQDIFHRLIIFHHGQIYSLNKVLPTTAVLSFVERLRSKDERCFEGKAQAQLLQLRGL